METEKGKIGIGTKEGVSLKPALVTILGYKIEMQKEKATQKEIGEKVSVICKHPDKPENIEISSVSYKKLKEIKTTGLWFKLDADNLIPKNSGMAQLLNILKASNLDEITGKEVMTELDEKGYLCFKAY
jgi:hypothetical protein